MSHYLKVSVGIGLVVFVAAMVFLFTVDSPSPYIGAGIVAFLIFELAFYHYFSKGRDHSQGPKL
ncbi:hypothetical protein LCM20_01205 [Halobacillus litoralis]|uniref:hypothetical protein n=1 Tax=Halobacillus litoralis TaxID=45668 RepID=UPI001CD320D0|nr:hypothetical protein [Halobacillus litoralis]MCA0969202.1 hypothetical protein [Halobacillus litoralis]